MTSEEVKRSNANKSALACRDYIDHIDFARSPNDPDHWFASTRATRGKIAATDVDSSNELGFVLQAGVDIPLNERGLGLSLAPKRYFVGTTATFISGDSAVLRSQHALDTWVLSAGLA